MSAREVSILIANGIRYALQVDGRKPIPLRMIADAPRMARTFAPGRKYRVVKLAS